MEKCEGLYAASSSNTSTYIWAAWGGLSFPLSFYLYFKYPANAYWICPAFAIIVTTAVLLARIIVARVRISIEETGLITESYFLTKWLPCHTITIDQIEKATHLSDSNSSTLQIMLTNGESITILKPEKSLLDTVRNSCREKYHDEAINEKQSFKVAMVFIGLFVADIALVFVAIYLST